MAAATGLDASAPYLDFARARTTNPLITFELGDAYKSPYADDAFDLTLSMLMLDVLADPGRDGTGYTPRRHGGGPSQ